MNSILNTFPRKKNPAEIRKKYYDLNTTSNELRNKSIDKDQSKVSGSRISRGGKGSKCLANSFKSSFTCLAKSVNLSFS